MGVLVAVAVLAAWYGILRRGALRVAGSLTALGLRRGTLLRLIVVPQALCVIVPPRPSQKVC